MNATDHMRAALKTVANFESDIADLEEEVVRLSELSKIKTRRIGELVRQREASCVLGSHIVADGAGYDTVYGPRCVVFRPEGGFVFGGWCDE